MNAIYCLFAYQGLRNDFKAAMEKIDQEYLAELIKQQVMTSFVLYCFVYIVSTPTKSMA